MITPLRGRVRSDSELEMANQNVTSAMSSGDVTTAGKLQIYT